MVEVRWHQQEANDVLKALDSSSEGLSQKRAEQRLQAQGPNALPNPSEHSLASIVIGQFTDVLILVLLAAALISGFIGDLTDTVAILVIVLFNAIIGSVQGYRAERAVAALKKMAEPSARALRDGTLITVPTTALVPGDIVAIDVGNSIPADLRLLETEDLQINESTLTGESQPVSKQSSPLVEPQLPLGDINNCAFKGSLVTHGRGLGVVIHTGLETEVGKIAALLKAQSPAKTPLQIRLANFGRYLSLAILAICLMIFTVGLLQGQAIGLMALTAISLAVAAIPEALPAVVAISLALGARKLLKHHALVRNLPSVETLGSVTCICSDKTGTLTENKMLAEFFISNGEKLTTLSREQHARLATAMALNNDIAMVNGQPTGEPTELALFEAARRNAFDKESLECLQPRIAAIPFDSVRKRMTTLHRLDTQVIAYVKGAPEQVLPLCTEGLNKSPETILANAEAFAAEGYRVLALASRVLPALPDTLDAADIEQALDYLGLVALVDPPRPEAQPAVQDCLSAGIKPIMITGDHPGTALAIAQRLTIADTSHTVLTADDLSHLSDAELQEQVKTARVYARVSPEQKLRIVAALQNNGEFVAMTGDGVNDAPALKQADIGVSMGQKGTDVAREASDMILLDDNFASIVKAVRTGRRIYDNIRKFIKDTMSSNSGEIWTLLLAPFLGLPIPLLPIHILWINLITDGLPGLAFTAEPAEPGVMSRPPRPPRESIFAHGMWQHILWVGLFVAAISIAAQAWAIAREAAHWQTIVFTVLTVSQLFHSIAVRSETLSICRLGIWTNIPMLLAISSAFLLQMAIVYLPAFNAVFHTQPLPAFDLLVCLGLSSLVFFAVEGEKYFIRRGWLYQTA